jgi:hypothetical protein
VSWSAARLGSDLHHEIARRLTRLLEVPSTIRESEHASSIALLHAAGRLTAADKHRISTAGLREVIGPCVDALAPPQPKAASEDAQASC